MAAGKDLMSSFSEGFLLLFMCAVQGRNAEEQVKMIQQVDEFNSKLPEHQKITISVEIEKKREPLYQLFAHGDVVRLSYRTFLTFWTAFIH